MDKLGVYAAIGKVMATLAKNGISKDRNNAQQGYKFRGIDDVYNALAPALVDASLIVIPSVTERHCEERQSASNKALFYVTVAATFDMICTADGSSVKAGPFYGEAMDSGDKATNKAMSAAYKYWAMQTFAIPTEGDNDADSHTHEVAARVINKDRPNTATQTAQDVFNAMADDEKDFIRSHAAELKKLFPLGDLLAYLDNAKLDNDEKLALWSQLPSDVRSAIKKQQQEVLQAAGLTSKPITKGEQLHA